MTRAAVFLSFAAAAGAVLAHPGHGAAEGHLHGWGAEHLLLLALGIGAAIFFLRKK